MKGMFARQILFGVLFLAKSFFTLNAANEQNVDALCSAGRDCSECMQAHRDCYWCVAEDYQDSVYGRNYRCATRDTLLLRGCAAEKMDSSQSKLLKQDTKEKTQLVPSQQSIVLRPNEVFTLNITFNQIEDYPVDLYYLTDISYSMKDDLATVSRLALEIANSMQKLTSQFRIGFGSFVDKPVFPFVEESVLINPCQRTGSQANEQCDPPYVLQHFLSLTPNISMFQEKTKTANASGNIDAPEGGLDALMQVALCSETIGWNEDARKIVLFTTDGGFHVAGDGRLAGLISPPPQECVLRMDADRNQPSLRYVGYHDSIYYDYPSVGELARVLEEKDISVIFAVIGNHTNLYSRLAQLLPVATVGAITNRSRNIVDLIQDNYQKIASSVELTTHFDSDLMKVEVLTRCNEEKTFSEKIRCEGHPLGKSIDYQVKVEVKRCLPANVKRKIKIAITGMKDESSIEVATACECSSCEKQPTQVTPSSKCNNQGTFSCGKCNCLDGISGDFCECSANDGKTEAELAAQCQNPKSSNNEMCSGRGRCECGKCKCNNVRYMGHFCECDTQSCRRASDNNMVCGGEQRGTCSCNGTCACKPGYSGLSCDCMSDLSPCFDSNNVSCSGHGDCDCGVCMCNVGYVGLKCDEPADQTNNAGLCQDPEVKECVLCTQANTHLTHNATSRCASKCENITKVTLNIETVHEKPGASQGLITCVLHNENNCRIIFTYRYSDEVFVKRKVYVSVLKTAECPAALSIAWIVIGVLLGVVFIGIVILLVWKLVVTIDDTREMARFVKDTQDAKWEMEENPIFKEPVTTVQNPMYNGGT